MELWGFRQLSEQLVGVYESCDDENLETLLMECCHWEIASMAAVNFDVFEDNAWGDSMLAVTINPNFWGGLYASELNPE
jgi:hypothetical protein